MPRILSAVVLTVCFFSAFSSPSFAETSYHTFLGDFQRTGFYYAKGPSVPELNFKLKIIENANFPFPYGVVTDNSGNIYVPARYKLFKYSPSGEKIWEYAVEPQSSWAMFTPLIYEDKLYFIASYATHHLFRLDLNGNLIWKKDLKLGSELDLSFLASPIIVGDIVYVPSSSSVFSIRAYNKDSGDFLGVRYFTGFSGPYLNASGVLASSNLLVSTITGEISGINLKRVFNEDINPVFKTHTLYLYRNTFQQGFNTNKLTLPSLDLSNNSRTYVLVNNAKNSKEAELLALNEVLQKDWGVLIEGTTSGNIVIGKEGNIYFELKNVLPKTGNTIYSYTKDGVRRWSYEYEGENSLPNMIIDSRGVLYIVSGKEVFALSSKDGFLLWEYELDNYSEVTPVLDNLGNLLVVDNKGNLYSFKGSGEYAGCKRRFYCNGDTPKHRPVVLVHGLGGSFNDWLTGNKREVRDLILQKYREDDPNFPDEWVYGYNYGYDYQGNYNYEGDVIMIARGMLETVNRLSKESLDAGGDGRVDLVGFSLGGLVIRQYLADTVGDTDTTEDDYTHNVDKAILIATPNKGSLIMTLDKEINAFPVLGPIIEGAMVKGVENYYELYGGNQPLHGHSPASLQVTPGSDFLKSIDNPNLLPEDVDYYTMGANLRARRGGVLYGFDAWTDYAELGDLAVEKESFEYLPRTAKQNIVYDDTMVIKWELAEQDNMWTIRAEVPNLETVKKVHWNIMQTPEVRETISNILINDEN